MFNRYAESRNYTEKNIIVNSAGSVNLWEN